MDLFFFMTSKPKNITYCKEQNNNTHTFDAGAKADAEATSANTTATVFIILNSIV